MKYMRMIHDSCYTADVILLLDYGTHHVIISSSFRVAVLCCCSRTEPYLGYHLTLSDPKLWPELQLVKIKTQPTNRLPYTHLFIYLFIGRRAWTDARIGEHAALFKQKKKYIAVASSLFNVSIAPTGSGQFQYGAPRGSSQNQGVPHSRAQGRHSQRVFTPVANVVVVVACRLCLLACSRLQSDLRSPC